MSFTPKIYHCVSWSQVKVLILFETMVFVVLPKRVLASCFACDASQYVDGRLLMLSFV